MDSFEVAQVIALRYVTTGGGIEICWPARVVRDSETEIALFIAAGTRFRTSAKMTAADKRASAPVMMPDREDVWRKDAVRLMFPGRAHSAVLFWDGHGAARRLAYYFINLEEPFRRTAVGIDTQDLTLDVVVSPELACTWRDEDELENHVAHGFYTRELAAAVRAEGEAVIGAIERRVHPCLHGWSNWVPESDWQVPTMPRHWDSSPPTFWEHRRWAYGCYETPGRPSRGVALRSV